MALAIVLIVLVICFVIGGVGFFIFRKKIIRVGHKANDQRRFEFPIQDLVSYLGGVQNITYLHAQQITLWVHLTDLGAVELQNLQKRFKFREVTIMRDNVLVIRTNNCAQYIATAYEVLKNS